jgi:uncharacterized RDD family membrane protein YckC
MKVRCVAVALIGLWITIVAPAHAQTGAAPPAQNPSATAPPPAPAQPGDMPQDFERITYARPVVRIGSPFTLAPNMAVSEAVVLMSDATIEGRVVRDVVVVLGNLRLGRTAVVEGSVVLVGGRATVDQGATIRDELVVVGGTVEGPPDFLAGGQHILVGPPGLGDAMRNVAPWFTRGLLWGRVIVPSLPWVWAVVSVVFLVNLALAVAFPRAVRACAETLSARPLAAFFVGMLTLLLVAPVSTILAVSVVGIIVIPFLFCALVVGWLLGKASVSQWIGAGIVAQDDPDSRAQTIRSLAIGFAVICLAYMVPLLGVAAWALVGVLGLGTATLTFATGLRRERPAPPPASPVPPPSAPEPPRSTEFVAAAAPVSAEASAPRLDVPAGASASGHPADLAAFPRATFLDRVAAAVLDVLLVAIAYNLFNWWHDGSVFLILLLGYHVAFWTWKGTTVGGIICSLRLVRTDGSALRPADALVRGLASLFSFVALGLGFLWILRDPERQAWHDRIAGTYVVSVPRTWPVP